MLLPARQVLSYLLALFGGGASHVQRACTCATSHYSAHAFPHAPCSAVQGVLFDDNQISNVRLDNDVSQLRVFSLPRNRLSGAMYGKLSQARQLVALLVAGNQFTSLPRSWDQGSDGYSLEVLDASDNAIEVRPCRASLRLRGMAQCAVWLRQAPQVRLQAASETSACGAPAILQASAISICLRRSSTQRIAASGIMKPRHFGTMHLALRAVFIGTLLHFQRPMMALCCCLQGDLPKVYAELTRLRTLNVAHNGLGGHFGDFQSAIQRGSTLINVQLQHNRIGGVLFPPAVIKLGAFGSRDFESPEDKRQPHVFNIAYNNLDGEVTDQLVSVRCLRAIGLRCTVLHCAARAMTRHACTPWSAPCEVNVPAVSAFSCSGASCRGEAAALCRNALAMHVAA